MVRGFSGSLDRDQSFIPGCIDIPLFFILAIGTGRVKEDSRSNPISVINALLLYLFFLLE
uniref:photosystem I subunit IX n=1 Tax=Vuralia turcica TaxID=1177745 RepID=UPI002A82DE51|nr:photosystem I subunit IX [Vuralia turcica]WOZ11481.1 photosystem I subunit IX [Vuralia turcica]